jgi:hypothetical protein
MASTQAAVQLCKCRGRLFSGDGIMVECIAVSILKCSIGDVFDPYIGNVVLLLGFEGADASTGAAGIYSRLAASKRWA